MESILSLLPDSPIVAYTILLLVILTVPPIFERLRLPGLVGLLVAGIMLGPNGLQLLDPETDMMKLLSDAGKIYLMFVAGLEIDLEEFRKTKERSLGFGFATFLLPLIAGALVGRTFGFGWNASILMGSLLASHTLLGYPIVNRLGVVGNQAVTVTIGATIFTDIAALLVLAICVSIHTGEFSAVTLFIQLVSLGVYSAAVLFGLDWAGKEYFRRSSDREDNQFLFILLAVFLAAVGAQIINVDKIVGAFLAGLAINDVVGHSPVEEKVEFVGSTLFIPFFFVDMGLLLNIPAFIKTITTELGMTLAIVLGLIASKFMASLTAKLLYRYNWNEALTMWSLSLPQVAATLAAALVGVNVGLISDSVFNAVIVLMLVTAVLGPVLTAKFAANLPVSKIAVDREQEREIEWKVEGKGEDPFTVVVPIYNPFTKKYLIEIAALLARHESGTIVPLSVAKASGHMDEPRVGIALKRSENLLDKALAISKEFEVRADPEIRIDDNVAQRITCTAKEKNASLIVMGWSGASGFRARLFGNLIDSVLWSAHCPVAVMRLLDEPVNIHRILVPVKNLMPQALRTVYFSLLFANVNGAQITLLHICDRGTPKEQYSAFESELSSYLSSTKLQVNWEIKTIRHDDIAEVIIQKSDGYDMVMLSSISRRTAGGLAVSDVTTQAIAKLNCSIVLVGEPHHFSS